VIIVDLNQVMISNLMVTIGNHTDAIEENLLRHFILNSIRSYNAKFKDQYGEMIIACDDKNYWRRQIFPYYKASRKKDRESSSLDWNAIFQSLNKIRDELKEYFPYRVIQIDTAEADDIIGTLCKEFGNEFPVGSVDPILIISGDKDFRQLQKYSNVKQYDPVRKRWLDEKNPSAYLKEHIMRGDKGDGVPNFLSSDDSFVLNTRQKPISQKKLDEWLKLEPTEFCDERMLRGWKRNEQMVNLELVPENVSKSIMDSYHAQAGKGRDKLFNYFIEHKLKNLLTDIGQF
jgi:5'-3' exonuclease